MKTTESILSPAQKAAVILALTEHIQSECSVVDMEQRFCDSLDSCYDFKSVGGPFVHMSPSSVLEAMDPVAFRCGVSDSSDHENVVEVEGEYYDADKVEEAREEFVADLQTELDEAQAELDGLENDEDDDDNALAEAERTIALLEVKIELATDHSF